MSTELLGIKELLENLTNEASGKAGVHQVEVNAKIRTMGWAFSFIAGVFLVIQGQLVAWAVETENNRYRRHEAEASHEAMAKIFDARVDAINSAVAHQTGLIVSLKEEVRENRRLLNELAGKTGVE